MKNYWSPRCHRAFVFPLLTLSLAAAMRVPDTVAQNLPEGEGREIVATACTQCHGLTPILQMRDGTTGWTNMVEEMVLRGAMLTPKEAETVARYLVQSFGPGRQSFPTGKLPHSSAVSDNPIEIEDIELPAGAGKELVQARCSICHDIGRVVTVKRSAADWERIARNMNDRGPQASEDQLRIMIDYLSTRFGP
jgi:cytochrome c5